EYSVWSRSAKVARSAWPSSGRHEPRATASSTTRRAVSCAATIAAVGAGGVAVASPAVGSAPLTAGVARPPLGAAIAGTPLAGIAPTAWAMLALLKLQTFDAPLESAIWQKPFAVEPLVVPPRVQPR